MRRQKRQSIEPLEDEIAVSASFPRSAYRLAAVVDLLDCLGIHLALAAWDDWVDHSDQADVEDLEEDLTCARSVELEVFDRAWVGSTSMGNGRMAGASENE